MRGVLEHRLLPSLVFAHILCAGAFHGWYYVRILLCARGNQLGDGPVNVGAVGRRWAVLRTARAGGGAEGGNGRRENNPTMQHLRWTDIV